MSDFFCVLLFIVALVSGSPQTLRFRPRHEANGKHLELSDIAPSHRLTVAHKYFGTTLFPNNDNRNANPLNKHTANNIPVIYITDYGGDPSGVNDSTAAFKAAINVATKYGAPNVSLAEGVHDCGGATIDLGGGDYLVSEPIYIPSNYGNIRIIEGTIRASNKFTPSTGYLLNVGDVNYNCTNSQHSCNENVGIENMMLDCKYNCYGALHVVATMGTVIGPQIFILGFNNAGITITGGHEAMIFNTWVAQYLYGDSRRSTATGTGIEIFGNDHYVSNTIVFGGKLGMHVTHPANVIEGVHTWNLGKTDNGTGFLIESHSIRLLDCYLDYNDLKLVAPIFLVSVEHTFFLGGGTLQLIANTKESEIRNLNVFDSQYSAGGKNPTVYVNESNGNAFTSVENVVMGGFMLNNNGYVLKSTVSESSLTLKNSTQWIFDFSDILVFNNIGINMIDYSINIDGNSVNQFVQHTARYNKNGNNSRMVIVETDKLCDATVYIKVDQSVYNPNPSVSD